MNLLSPGENKLTMSGSESVNPTFTRSALECNIMLYTRRNIMESEKLSMKEFVNSYCQQMAVSEFVDCFFYGNTTKAAAAFNVSRQTMHSWESDELMEVQVIYCDSMAGNLCFDYVLKRTLKRVGAESKLLHAETGYVYAVSNGTVTKIGASRKPEQRIKFIARALGFESYEFFISNACLNYKEAEFKSHKALSDKKRENTIYQRECFSCSIDEASSVISGFIEDMPSGYRKTSAGFAKKIINFIDGKETK